MARQKAQALRGAELKAEVIRIINEAGALGIVSSDIRAQVFGDRATKADTAILSYLLNRLRVGRVIEKLGGSRSSKAGWVPRSGRTPAAIVPIADLPPARRTRTPEAPMKTVRGSARTVTSSDEADRIRQSAIREYIIGELEEKLARLKAMG